MNKLYTTGYLDIFSNTQYLYFKVAQAMFEQEFKKNIWKQKAAVFTVKIQILANRYNTAFNNILSMVLFSYSLIIIMYSQD